MINRCSTSLRSLPSFPLHLQSAWEVDTDDTYDMRRSRVKEELIVLRTSAGRGDVTLTRPVDRITAEPDSLLILPGARIHRYRCRGGRWAFWWFACSRLEPDLPPVNRTPPLADEPERLAEIGAALRSGSATRLRLASCTLGWLLARWLDGAARHASGEDRDNSFLERAIAAMHATLDAGRPLRIAALAAACGLGERTFRTRFRDATDCTPKRYANNLRLRRAELLITRHGWSVARTADALGYSSPFHLSKACRRQRGHPPSKWLVKV